MLASDIDSRSMARAIQLAARGQGFVEPNPMVGCVLVRDGAVVGEGWPEFAGAAHAEINALGAAGASALGATAYLTLEPCSHEGKTPPCAPALIEAGIVEVVIAMEDPFPAVSGSGRASLEAAGITVRSGLMQDAAESLNAGFLGRVRAGRPFVRLKVASSIDGAIAVTKPQAMASGTVITSDATSTPVTPKPSALTANRLTPSRRGSTRSANEPAQADRRRGGRPITMPRIARARTAPSMPVAWVTGEPMRFGLSGVM